jgi:hypothetical protein
MPPFFNQKMTDTQTPIMSCRHVWKLYGDDPAAFMLQHNTTPSADAIKCSLYWTINKIKRAAHCHSNGGYVQSRDILDAFWPLAM